MPRRSRSRRNTSVGEALEVRALLSTITVTSLEDNEIVDGEVTLREAIRAANTDASVDGSVAGSGADLIKFADGLKGGTITLEQGELTISKTLTIDGPRGRVTIDANKASRHFKVSAVTRAKFQDLRLINGRADDGGSIDSEAVDLLLVRSRFVNNVANSTGGAIRATYRPVGGSMLVRSSRLVRNRAERHGGAVFVNGRSDWEASIENSLVRENVGDGVFVVLDSRDRSLPLHGIRDKPAVVGSRFIANGSGSDRASIYASTVEDSYFAENRGRGVLSQVAQLRDSLFERNDPSRFVVETAAVNADANIETVEYATITNTRILESDSAEVIRIGSLCTATDMPASVLQMTDSTIDGHDGRFGGGVIGDDCSAVELTHSTVTGVDRDAISADYVTLRNTSVVDNTAFGVRGVLDIHDSTIARNKFGGLDASGDSTISNTTISENRILAIVATSEGNLQLNNVTIFGNVLRHNYPAVRNAALVQNSIISHNMTPEGQHYDLTLLDDAEVSHSLIGVNRGNDLEEARPGSPDDNGNFVGTTAAPVNAQLGVLADRGEGVLTHAASPNSPVLDAADSTSSEGVDQLGRERIGAGPDMGSIEFDPNRRTAPEVRMFLESREETEGKMQLYVGLSDLPEAGETVIVDLSTRGIGVHPATPGVDYMLDTTQVVFDSNSPPIQIVPITLVDDDIGREAPEVSRRCGRDRQRWCYRETGVRTHL